MFFFLIELIRRALQTNNQKSGMDKQVQIRYYWPNTFENSTSTTLLFHSLLNL